MSGSILIYGDPHGDWRPLFRAVQEEKPDGVVILGDCDLAVPLRQQHSKRARMGDRSRLILHQNSPDRIAERIG